MERARRILVVADNEYKPAKLFISFTRRLAKGLTRLGHDVETFSFYNAFFQFSPLKSKRFGGLFFKSRVDRLLAQYARQYAPDVILINFPRLLDGVTLSMLREAVPDAVFVGCDGDPWPEHRPNQMAAAPYLDHVVATNNGRFLESYRAAGVPHCHFLPNSCDPDYEKRYSVSEKWRSEVLWTGKVGHHADINDPIRKEVVERLAARPGAAIYGCLNRPAVTGFNYYYAISGTRIGVHVNVVNDVPCYHSDRLTHYLSTGAFVLAKRVPDTESLFVEGRHLRYFDTIEELESLLDWYSCHEKERERIARTGMEWTHLHFNCRQMASHLVNLIDKGSYAAPWTA